MDELSKQAWIKYSPDLDIEVQQAYDEGKDTAGLAKQVAEIRAAEPNQQEALAGALLDRTPQLPLRADFTWQEPDDLQAIQALTPNRGNTPPPSSDPGRLPDQINGAWLGRISGCLLGKPVESWKRERIAGFNRATGNWPITNYMHSDHPQDIIDTFDISDQAPFGNGHNSWINLINCAPVDDDTNYTVLNLLVMEQYGRRFMPQQIGFTWLDQLPILQTFTAERIAYRNMAAGLVPPQSGQQRNIYREYIGAQIRADLFGYTNPDHPDMAAEMAWRDAAVSHTKNGIYGEMWAAAMIAAAFGSTSPADAIRAGMDHIPRTSRLHAALSEVLTCHAQGIDFESWLEQLMTRWDENHFYHWAHTIPNAAIVAAALLHGRMDFTRTIGLAVGAGFDTDCNAATAGSVVGAMLGAAALPSHWIAPLNDRLLTSLRSAPVCSISDLSARTLRLVL